MRTYLGRLIALVSLAVALGWLVGVYAGDFAGLLVGIAVMAVPVAKSYHYLEVLQRMSSLELGQSATTASGAWGDALSKIDQLSHMLILFTLILHDTY